MKKILFLLPLVLVGCDSQSNIPVRTAYQASPDQVTYPQTPQSSLVLDLSLYAVNPAPIDNSDWTARLKGLPVVLNDVLWSGNSFIAVGDSGVILTSVDGIDWVQRSSGTGADLYAISSDGLDIVVVGDYAAVLLSSDGGESWTVKYGESGISLHAVVVNAWQIVAGGRYQHSEGAFMVRSEDRGESWTPVESLPPSGHRSTDLTYAGGMFVAATDIPSWSGGTRVWVSVDGKDWQDIVIWDEPTAGLYAILHDGNRFVVAGDYGAVFTSPDGVIWSQSEAPLEEISYMSAARSGTALKLAGGITGWYWGLAVEPLLGELDVGLSSSDGGLTWDAFNIDGYFESLGMASGNGRFVSVGQSTPFSGEGAIYTAD